MACMAREKSWQSRFVFTYWIIWCGCNNEVLDNNARSIQYQLHNIHQFCEDWKHTTELNSVYGRVQVLWLVSWCPSLVKCFKINVDGSSLRNPGKARAGGTNERF